MYGFASAQDMNRLATGSLPDTTFISYSPLQRAVPSNKPYHQTLTLKLFLSQAGFEGKYKRKDDGSTKVFLTIEEALAVIKKIDRLTIGIPKIIYLVGWQYNGHDSKYPAWFAGNEKLKRPQDKDCLESIRWLMAEAEKYHTTVSLHINMFDAYEDSPLWEEYVTHDIIAKNADGTLRAAEWGYPVSYAREWETGFAQRRIDSLCKLLPVQRAGTIHIDAFHSWPPMPVEENGVVRIDLSKSPISPFLGFTVEDETEAQRSIFRYWSSKGIDVTSEGVDFLRATSFEGYQAMAWWFSGLSHYLNWPADFYCGGKDNSEWGKLFGTSMHGEDIIRKDPTALTGFREEFCLSTIPWYFLNRLDRRYLLTHADYKAVQYSGNVRTFLAAGALRITQGETVLLEDDNLLMPAPWIGNTALVAYSKNGYQHKSWDLPEGFRNAKKLRVYTISTEGKKKAGVLRPVAGKISLSLEKDQMLLLEKIR